MKLSTLLLLVLLVACGQSIDKNYIVRDAELVDYVQRFENITQEPVRFSVTFDDLEKSKAGICVTYSDYSKEVFIDRFIWARLNDLQREQLIFHELGHCILDRDHNDNTLSNGCPASIMRSYLFNVDESFFCYSRLHDYYIAELFGGNK